MNEGLSVSKLTAMRHKCHKPDARRATLGILAGITVLLCWTGATAGEWHDPANIASTAEDYLRGKLAALSNNRNGETRLTAGMLDQRLKLAACDKPLTGFMRAGTKIGPKTVVGVRCSGSKPWKVYVPVEMSVTMKIWVASKALPRGHILSADDMVAELRNVSRQTTGYFQERDSLVGQRLRSSILAGRAFEPQIVEADNVIRRGQSVTLAVQSNGINIRMSGKALTDGAINQRIRVENLNSGRVVEGIVRSRELVEVLMPATDKFSKFTPKVSPSLADTGISNNDS